MQADNVVIDDAVLIERINSGTDIEVGDAYEVLFGKYHHRLLYHLACKGLSSTEQQDIESETWVRAYLRIGKYEYRGISFLAWLKAIADNVAKEWFKRRYLGLSIEQIETEEGIQFPTAPGDSGLCFDDNLRKQELRDVLQKVIKEAPEDYALIIEAQCIEGFNVDEIIGLTGWSQSKVYTTKHRASHWLKDTLTERYGANALQVLLG